MRKVCYVMVGMLAVWQGGLATSVGRPLGTSPQFQYYIHNPECGSDNDFDKYGPTEERARIETHVQVRYEDGDGNATFVTAFSDRYDCSMVDQNVDSVAEQTAWRLGQWAEGRLAWDMGVSLQSMVASYLEGYASRTGFTMLARAALPALPFGAVALVFLADAA
ncbi:MAG: hypothetical protein U0Q12_09140 [Vicinamibacterales bacterium]